MTLNPNGFAAARSRLRQQIADATAGFAVSSKHGTQPRYRNKEFRFALDGVDLLPQACYELEAESCSSVPLFSRASLLSRPRPVAVRPAASAAKPVCVPLFSCASLLSQRPCDLLP